MESRRRDSENLPGSWRSDSHALLADINCGDADRVEALLSGVRRQELIRVACRQFATAVTRPLSGAEYDSFPNDPSGARAIVQILGEHPAFAEGREVRFAEAVLGPQGLDPAEFDTRGELAEFLTVGLAALMSGGEVDDRAAAALIGVALGADTFSRVVRDIVLGGYRRGLDLDLNNLIPSRILDLDLLDRAVCVVAIQDAAVELGRGFRPPRSWATGITGLNPSVGCPGDTVVIQGSGFGATQPNGVVVLFPRQAGECVEAQVSTWSDTAVTVVVPNSAGSGCVGFGERGSPASAEAASTFAGVLERCIGPAAFRVSGKIRQLGGLLPPPPCPGCLAGGRRPGSRWPMPPPNRFDGGPPSIDGFTANSGHDIAVEPGDRVVLDGMSGTRNPWSSHT